MTDPRRTCDFLIVGGGMAGCSAAFFLADKGSVIVLERESQPGYHSTGRSAALYSGTYGNAQIRGLTRSGWTFFTAPPAGFTDHPMLTPRGVMMIARDDQRARLQAFIDEIGDPGQVRPIIAEEARRHVPALRPDYAVAAAYEPDAMDIDVHALHQGFIRGLRAKGGQLVTDAEVLGAARKNGEWAVETPAGTFRAPVLINAGGAWGDVLAEIVGAKPVGLVPKRRTALTFRPPAGSDVSTWPATIDAEESFYFRPDAGMLLGSPADETPIEPCDVQPEEIDVAVAVDRITTATTLEIRRIEHKWAGLRSFVADKTPVVGFDDKIEGFFWLIGQGGYGIQTSPGLGRLVGELASGGKIPPDIAERGVREDALSPTRVR